MPLFWASRFWQCHRLCSPMGRQAHPRQSRAPQRQAVSCTEIRASQIPHPFFPVFEFSLLAGRSGLGDKAGVLSLPSALRQQAWMLAELLPDLCQALLIQNSSSWIEGSSCYVNSGEGGEASVFKGVERHTGNHLNLELLLALTLLLYGGESQGWVSFFCLDLKVWMLLLLGPGSAAASPLQSCQWSHFGFVTGNVTWDLPAKLTTWISLFGLQALLFYAATDFLPILPLHSRNLFDLNKEEGSWRSLVLLWAHLADVGLASHRVSVSLLNGVVGTTAALQMATKAERC